MLGPSLALSFGLDFRAYSFQWLTFHLSEYFGPIFDVLSPLFGRHYVLYLEELQDPGDGSLLEPTGVCPVQDRGLFLDFCPPDFGPSSLD